MADYSQYATQANANFLIELIETLEELEILTSNLKADPEGQKAVLATLRSHCGKL